MTTPAFFPEEFLQQIIQTTGGVLCVHRGQEAYFHCENPTVDVTMGYGVDLQGVVRMLVGSAKVFPNLEEGDLITVAGDDFNVGTWTRPDDGGVIYIFLKKNSERL